MHSRNNVALSDISRAATLRSRENTTLLFEGIADVVFLVPGALKGGLGRAGEPARLVLKDYFHMIWQEVGEDEGELILVLNWLEEVKRQVGNR